MRQRRTLSIALSIAVGILAGRARAALESGVYQTLAGATMEERGDAVPGGSRVVPISANLTLDLSATPPSLVAVMPNAVLEGGDPFALTVRSSSGFQVADDTYRFSGDYLADIYPSGTQYEFDWSFSASTNGAVVWNGIAGWAGGHAWYLTVSNVMLVPQARLSITRVGSLSVEVAWATNLDGYILECAAGLPDAGWITVTNSVTTTGNRRFVTVDMADSHRFYRLRKP